MAKLENGLRFMARALGGGYALCVGIGAVAWVFSEPGDSLYLVSLPEMARVMLVHTALAAVFLLAFTALAMAAGKRRFPEALRGLAPTFGRGAIVGATVIAILTVLTILE